MPFHTLLPALKTLTLHSLRRKSLLLFGALLFGFAPDIQASAPKLFVFVTADMRAQSLEKAMETSLPGVDVTVFSRVRGFGPALAAKPDAVLARRFVLEGHGLSPQLQGYYRSSPTERYVLLSRSTPVSPESLRGKTLGVVNLLGREEMDAFVRKMVGSSDPKLQQVTHERDLLALLQFNVAQAVLVSESWARKFESSSEMDLKMVALPNPVGLPAVAFSSSSARSALESKIKAAGSSFEASLGVQEWR